MPVVGYEDGIYVSMAVLKKTVVPEEIRAPVGASEMVIVWSDGTQSTLSNEALRGFCPCAGCQGHSGGIHFRRGGNSVLEGIAEVGNYALSLRWGDGHDSGIYSFEYLLRLARSLDGCTDLSKVDLSRA
jgi:DUF971 family protein